MSKMVAVSTKRKRVAACELLAFLCLCGAAESRVISLEETLRSHSDEITLVKQCGRWKQGQQSGFYKIIAAEFLFGGSRLWVQWMADRDDDGWTHAVHTLTLQEVNEEHVELLFGDVQCERAGSGIVLRFTSEDGHQGAIVQVEISVFEEYGRYLATMNRSADTVYTDPSEQRR